MIERGASLLGIAVLIGAGYAFSKSRKHINWRIVVVGIALQVYLALFMVRPDWVPVMLTASAALCAGLIVVDRVRPLGGYWAPASRGLGLLGAATTTVHLVTHHGGFHLLPILGLLVALVGLMLLWRLEPTGVGLLGNIAIIAAIWGLGLPHDFLFRAVAVIGAVVNWLSGLAVSATDLLVGGYRKSQGGFVFAINVPAIILFYSALMAILYHWGILGKLVGLLAKVLRGAMGVTGAESLAAASNVFMGQTEAPLVVRPYLSRMTQSELMALMAGGFATIAGSVLGIYVQFLESANFARGAADLIAASVMSAPAAFVFAKLFVPETEEPMNEQIELPKEDLGVNVLDTLAGGVTAGIRLAVNVVFMLLVFYALLDLLDTGVNWGVKELFAKDDVNFRTLYSYLFAPFAFLLGVPWQDCLQVGELLGTKTIFNEFIAYERLAGMIKDGTIQPRSAILSTYALCGFANFMSIGIQIAGLSGLCPGRRSDFSRLALRAMIAGALACQLTACIVGVIGTF
ncbi:MAG: NupC/NupG family nucleoside CNT transporter [Planctomycetota bacterium]